MRIILRGGRRAGAWPVGAEARAGEDNLFGIDVSHYRGSPNWSSVHSCGARYALATKATEGTYCHDASFNYNMANGKPLPTCKWGAYDFARPDLL